MKKVAKMRLIIIEDSSFARAMIYSHLKSLGFDDIDLPEDSAEAWDLIAHSVLNGNPYDLIITDLNMPEIDGMDLIQKIKSEPECKDLKVMVISSESEQAIINAALAAGAQEYLVKPISLTDLKESLIKLELL